MQVGDRVRVVPTLNCYSAGKLGTIAEKRVGYDIWYVLVDDTTHPAPYQESDLELVAKKMGFLEKVRQLVKPLPTFVPGHLVFKPVIQPIELVKYSQDVLDAAEFMGITPAAYQQQLDDQEQSKKKQWAMMQQAQNNSPNAYQQLGSQGLGGVSSIGGQHHGIWTT
jgi:hypothetical protein